MLIVAGKAGSALADGWVANQRAIIGFLRQSTLTPFRSHLMEVSARRRCAGGSGFAIEARAIANVQFGW